jgi:HemY protein
VLLALALVAALGWRVIDAGRIARASIPARPDLASAPSVLRERIDSAEQRARSWRGSADGLAELARLYHANGFLAPAQETYRGLIRLQPRDPRWPHSLASILTNYGQLEEALPLLRRTIELAPDYEPARVRLEEALAKTNSRASAAAANPPGEKAPDPWLDDILSECYDAYRLRVAAAAASDNATAERWLQRALHVAPDDAAVHRQMGDLLTRRGDHRAARSHLDRAVELAPKDADNWAYLLRLLELTGDAATAERVLATALTHCPQSPSLHLERGRRLHRAGQFEAALAALETSRKLRPQEVDAYVEMSTVYFRLNRVNDGIAALRQALTVEPAHPVVLSSLAFCAIGIGDEAMARRTLEEARAQPRLARAELDQLVRRFGERFGRAPW